MPEESAERRHDYGQVLVRLSHVETQLAVIDARMSALEQSVERRAQAVDGELAKLIKDLRGDIKDLRGSLSEVTGQVNRWRGGLVVAVCLGGVLGALAAAVAKWGNLIGGTGGPP